MNILCLVFACLSGGVGGVSSEPETCLTRPGRNVRAAPAALPGLPN